MHDYIEMLRTINCLSYDEFLQMLDWQDNAYTYGKFSDMRNNLARFLMNLDNGNLSRVDEYISNKIASR